MKGQGSYIEGVNSYYSGLIYIWKGSVSLYIVGVGSYQRGGLTHERRYGIVGSVLLFMR